MSRWGTAAAIVAMGLAVASAAPAPAQTGAAFFDQQWGLRQIGAPAAWEVARGNGVRVAIIDTGIDLAHRDFEGKIALHVRCVGTSGDPARCSGDGQDIDGHGSHVAGIVTSRGIGVAGAAPDAQLIAVNVFQRSAGGPTASVSDVNAGIRWAVDRGARVVNLSLGNPNFVFTGLFGTGLRAGIEYAYANGAVVALASGNTNLLGFGSSDYGDLNALVVGATGPNDQEASYSSSTGNAKWGLVAPGGGNTTCAADPSNCVISAYWVSGRQDQYAHLRGTSMAAPHVAGTAALLFSQGLGRDAVIDRILRTLDTSVACTGDCRGRIDAARAVGAGGATSPAPSPTTQPAAGAESPPPGTAPPATAPPSGGAAPTTAPTAGTAPEDDAEGGDVVSELDPADDVTTGDARADDTVALAAEPDGPAGGMGTSGLGVALVALGLAAGVGLAAVKSGVIGRLRAGAGP